MTLVALAWLSSVGAAPPFTLTPPPGLEGPATEHAALGATYAWHAEPASGALMLTITTLSAGEISAQVGALTEVQCINLFLAPLRERHERFFVVAMARPLQIAGTEFPQFRWSGDRGGRTLTGILSCGRIGADWYVVHFADELLSAARAFPAIRASLRSLRPH